MGYRQKQTSKKVHLRQPKKLLQIHLEHANAAYSLTFKAIMNVGLSEMGDDLLIQL